MNTQYRIAVNGREVDITLLNRSGSTIEFAHEGTVYSVDITYIPTSVSSRSSEAAAPLAAPSRKKPVAAAPDRIVSPMPGRIVSVNIQVGDRLAAGDTVLVMEAMKMENNIQTEASGVVEEVLVEPGNEVEAHQPLVLLKIDD